MTNSREFESKLCTWPITETEENVSKSHFHVIIETKKIKNVLKIVLDMGRKYRLMLMLIKLMFVSYKRMQTATDLKYCTL